MAECFPETLGYTIQIEWAHRHIVARLHIQRIAGHCLDTAGVDHPLTSLILGGARSGKSSYAESLARDFNGPRVYIATAEAGDSEMAERIAAHRKRRGHGWRTVEEATDLPAALADAAGTGTFILVDCLTLWISNLLLAEEDCDAALDALIDTLGKSDGQITIVSNEVGLGIVPDNALARRFRDIAGLANQRVAAACDEVILVTAGLPQKLK